MGKYVGISGWGTYVPDNFISSAELAQKTGLPEAVIEEKLGIKRKAVAKAEDHCSVMAVKAAKKALKVAQIDASDLDLIIYTGDEYKDYPIWTAGIKVKEELKAVNAFSFDVSLRCGTKILALKLAKDILNSDKDIKRVLLTGGYRNGDLIDYQNPRVRFMYNLGAGASAVILEKDYHRNQLLEFAFVDDGSLSETVAVKAGGTKVPLSCEQLLAKGHYLDVLDSELMQDRLAQVSMDNFFKVIDTALSKSGLKRCDIDYLALLHMKRSAHNFILNSLNLNNQQSIYLENYGHLGQNDQILSIELGLEQGLIKEQDNVLLVSAGVGYAWNAGVIKWGGEKNDVKA